MSEQNKKTAAGGKNARTGRGDPRQRLTRWRVPLDFPVEMIGLGTRMINFCRANRRWTIGQLVDTWEEKGREYFLGQKNLGELSVGRLERFMEALRQGKGREAAEFLPLVWPGGGLSLSRALALAAAGLPAEKRALLEQRWVGNLSGRECGDALGVTRQAVALSEAAFLGEIKRALDYFAGDRDRLLAAWRKSGTTTSTLKLGPDRAFLAAALAAIFRSGEKGLGGLAADKTLTRQLLDERFKELAGHPDLWFGGVDFQRFLRERIPEYEREGFGERVFRSLELRFHFTDGRVRPRRTGLRPTMEALLATRKGRIRFSVLMELLAKTRLHPAIHPSVCRKKCKDWQRQYGFPFERIVWDR
jgi:DNA-directed RNA polymerase specialized sigma24 family protein